TFVAGQPVTQFYLNQPVEARLAAPDGPSVRFEPAASGSGQAAAPPWPGSATQAPPPWPVAAGPPAAGPEPGIHPAGMLHTLIPIKTWLTDPALRQWPRLLIAAYALAPVILLILLQNTTDLKTLGWVYCLYIAPLWGLVFWWLIRPGPIGRLHLGIAAVIVVAEFILIPALTTPW